MFLAMLVALLAMAACSGSKEQAAAQDGSDSVKMIVCYFSATGTTEMQAQRLAALTGADLMEIKPEVLYTEADLDWRDSLSRSSKEMADPASRPAIAAADVDLAGYDVVLVGYPNWWNTCPRLINTFIEANNLDGKTVAPFMTSGGSDIVNSERELSEAYPAINWKPGLLMNAVSDDQITGWVKTVSE